MKSAKNRPPSVLIIASGNTGKVREFSQLLEAYPLEIRPQPAGIDVEETGQTFAENARIKAIAVAKATGHWALADDSGLCVEALGGAPGIHSARYAGSDAERIKRLLTELEAVGAGKNRRAVFVAALAIADPTGQIQVEVEGQCPGEILCSTRGTGGFGYDPIFYVQEAGKTFAEMDKAMKSQIGHRGRAFSILQPKLRALVPTAM